VLPPDSVSPGSRPLRDIGSVFEVLRRLPPIVLLPGRPGHPARLAPLDDPSRSGYAGDIIVGVPVLDGPVSRTDAGPRPETKARRTTSGGAPLVVPRTGPPAPIAPSLAADQQRDRTVLVALADASTDEADIDIATALNLDREVAFRSSLLAARVVRYRIPDNRSIQEVLAAIAARAGVISASPEYVYRPVQGAGRAALGPQYAIDRLRVAEAHRIALGRNVRIAVVDTGIDDGHPELKGAVADSFDAIGHGRPRPEPHGTSIAGILVARGQMKGIAPEARVISVRAFSTDGAARSPEATTLSLIKGLEWAFISGTRLYNLSFAGPRDPLLEQLLERAEAQGAVFVAAAGNAGPGAAPVYPAAYKTVIAVTAVDSSDRVYPRASRGPYVAIAAPGVDILAPTLDSGYGMASGTSMAAAHVTGVVALVMERRPGLKAAQIREVLLRSVRPGDPSSARDIGAGILDAGALLEAVAR
jgi:hypothetical protein